MGLLRSKPNHLPECGEGRCRRMEVSVRLPMSGSGLPVRTKGCKPGFRWSLLRDNGNHRLRFAPRRRKHPFLQRVHDDQYPECTAGIAWGKMRHWKIARDARGEDGRHGCGWNL